MKTRTLVGFGISVAVVVLIGSYGQVNAQTQPTVFRATSRATLSDEMLARVAKRIVFRAKLSDDMLARAAKLQVYELQPARVNLQTFNARAKQLFSGELNGSPVQVNGVISMVDAEKASNFMMLELRTGYLSFNRGMADQIDDKPGNLPSDDRAVEIARDFLQKNKLGPGNPREMTLAHIGHIRSASFDPKTGKEGPVRDQMLTVYFSRKLDDVPFIGSGSKLIVRIGDGGKVVGGAHRWTEHVHSRGLEKKDLRSVSELMKDIQTFLSKEMDESERIEIVQFILVYYDNGGKYIQPALAYEANVIGKELKYAYLGQTALLQWPPERVGPEPVSKEAMRSLKRSSPD